MPRKKYPNSPRTFLEWGRHFTGQRKPRVNSAKLLRGLVTLWYAIYKSGLGIEEFSLRFVESDRVRQGEASKSGLIYQWLRKAVIPSRDKFEPMDREIEGVLELYDHVVFDLLEDASLSNEAIATHLSRYIGRVASSHQWKMPGEVDYSKIDRSAPSWVPVLGRANTQPLAYWRNIDGFTIILGLVREAENSRNTLDHMRFISHLYQALPTVLAVPWFRNNQRLFCTCVQQIHLRELLSPLLLHVHWALMHTISLKVIQDKIGDVYRCERYWRILEAQGISVVEEHTPPLPLLFGDHYNQRLRRNRNYFERVLDMGEGKARTIVQHDDDIDAMGIPNKTFNEHMLKTIEEFFLSRGNNGPQKDS